MTSDPLALRAALLSPETEGPWHWVERSTGRTLTDPERLLVELICRARRTGPWNLTPWTSLQPWGAGARVSVRDGWATYDTEALTRLVCGAHDLAARVVLVSSGPNRIGVVMHLRTPGELSIMRGHNTLEKAFEAWRSVDWITGRARG